ncbi:MAG TPA: hypothetical protein DCY97_07790 [Marinilabiliales bacterium]|nr:hypothetical protein [Marinilabiliales bacterium]
MENKKQLFSKISDYYSGESQQSEIRKEFESNSESDDLFQWVDRFWTKLYPKAVNKEQIKLHTFRKIDNTEKPVASFLLKTIKYAAAIIMVLGIAGIIIYYQKEDVAVINIHSGIGEVKTVDLPDGSKAWLNAQSSLSYPESFTGSLRELEMDGEVYFEVKHDVEHPFIVHSERMSIKVLGTSFMISSYTNEPVVGAHLAEGSIELSLTKLNKTMKLVPGDEVTLNKATSIICKRNNPNSPFDSWRLGKISFYNESLYQIARKLERKFGTKIHISDENVGNMKCTADFDSENLDQILNYFSQLQGIQYKTVVDGYLLITK